MLKKWYLLLMVFLLVFVAGCDESNKSSLGFSPYVGGNRGISLEFISGAPPDVIFDNGQYPFSVSVKINNQGEHDIEQDAGFLEIRGISPEEFGVTSANLRQPIPEIRGTRKSSDGSVLEGQMDVVTFDDLKYVQNIIGNIPINNFRVRACYDYSTKASSQLCIKEGMVDGMKGNEVCMVNEEKRVVNSGAPIQVSNLRSTSKGKSGIQISFDIVHLGAQGNRWFPAGDPTCDDRLTNQNQYKVKVDVGSIINERYPAQCSGGTFNGGSSGEVTLFNGESIKVICSFEIGEQTSDFETRLNIELSYRYLQHIEKGITIKDLGVSN